MSWGPVPVIIQLSVIYPFPNDKFLDCSKLKEIANDNFKFDVMGKKFSRWVKNTVGKGEIARNEQFLLFPQCFQKKKKKKLVLQTRKNQGLSEKGLWMDFINPYVDSLRIMNLGGVIRPVLSEPGLKYVYNTET